MSAQRGAMAAELRHRLQREADQLQLGVKIMFVGLEGVHPPVSVAEAFQSVIGATEEREATILKARADANRVLPLAQAEATHLEEKARAYAVRQQAIAAAEADRFTKRRIAYQESPAVFRTRLYLDTLERALLGSRKYIVAATPESEVYLLDFSEKLAPDLFDVGPVEKE
jgi:membrane protease subunit HflK